MTESKINLRTLMVVTILGLGFTLAACEKKDETPIEKMSEAVQDGLNTRENEKMKDAAEDAQDAMENFGEAIEEKAEEVSK